MKFDDLLETVGEFGPYQKWIFLLTCLTNLQSGIFVLIPVILLGEPKHRCALSGLDNDTYQVQNDHHRQLVNITIPSSDNPNMLYDQCHVLTSTVSHDNQEGPVNNSVVVKCNGYVYDKSVFESTFVSENDFVCDKSIYTANAQMLFYAGMLVGSVVSGIAADRYGRKTVLNVSLWSMLVSSIAIAFSPSYAVFVTLFFVLGASVLGFFMPAFVLGLEIVGPSKRVLAGVAGNLVFVLGLLILAGVGYGLRHWKHIELAVAIPGVIFISYWWLVPESPRWLLSQGRETDAEVVIKRIAQSNKTSVPGHLVENVAPELDKDGGKFWLLFTSKTMCIRTSVLFLDWFTASVAYFGLSLNIGSLKYDFYLNFALYGLIEIPAYLLCLLSLHRIGRRTLYCVSIITGGVACLATIFTSAREETEFQILTSVLGIVGKFAVTIAFAVLYVFSAELFPTVVRNAGMGGASFSARLGGMFAPYLVQLGELVGGSFGQAFPLILIGAISLLSGLLSIVLPETLNRHLPETILDAHTFGRRQVVENSPGKPDLHSVQGDDSAAEGLLGGSVEHNTCEV